MPDAADVRVLEELLWASGALFAARLDDDGGVLAANDALCVAIGRDPVGESVAALVAEPQRPALLAHVRRAGDSWTAQVVGFWHGQSRVAEDRIARVRRVGPGELLLVAETAAAERDRLVEQVLHLNDDLIESQRALGRRQREVERAQAGAVEAEGRLRRLEAVVLAGFTSRDVDSALERMLVLARDALGGERAAILLVDEPGTLRVHAALDMDIVGDITPFGTGVSGVIASTVQGMLVDDIAAAPGLALEHQRFRGSLAGVPLVMDGAVIGVLHVSTEEIGRFGSDELRLLQAVGDRASLAIGHAQLRDREQRIAETLQRSLLPRALPAGGALALTARYLPRATEGGSVGGDFYDAVPLPGGRLGLAIGDVAGKGLAAAATMGQVRAALHAYALEDEEPGSVLDRLDRFVAQMESMATAMFVVLDADGHMTIASAGHPPAVIVDPSGARLEAGALSPPLGADVRGRGQLRTRLPEDARMLLYTDGLIERRGEALDQSIEGLRALVASAPAQLDALCDRVLEALEPERGWPDDVALLAVRRGPARP